MPEAQGGGDGLCARDRAGLQVQLAGCARHPGALLPAPRHPPAYAHRYYGGEFIANELCTWLTGLGIQLVCSEPGKPWHNASSDSFNGTFRRGHLSRHESASLAEAKVVIEQWRRIYNEIRPEETLGNVAPRQYLMAQSS